MSQRPYCLLTRRELVLGVVAALAMGACTSALIAFAYVRSAACPIDNEEPVVLMTRAASQEIAQ